MSYIGFHFLIFVIISLLAYYIFPKIFPKKYQWVVLLIASVIFYLSYDHRFMIFLLLSVLCTYMGALIIDKQNRHQTLALVVCLAINALLWFIPKSYNWFALTLNRVFGKLDVSAEIPLYEFLIPLGISYFILQSIAYIIDVYRKNIHAEKNPCKLFLFISYFPAIVQGPISRYSQLSAELFGDHPFHYQHFCEHLLLIIYGLTKKLVIADRIAVIADYCFEYYADLSGFTLYIGALAYTIQLYMDFSGCVDLCRGVSGLFGVNLIHNFQQPYFSQSIKEFWQKWHISLSRWLRDYIYIPLGGNRKGSLRKNINLIITFLVSGLWHGAGFNFFVWGGLHSLYQIIGDYYRKLGIQDNVYRLFKIEKNSTSQKIYSAFITFHLVLFAWIFFRSSGLQASMRYIINMFHAFNIWVLFDGSLLTYGLDLYDLIVLFVNIALVFYIEYRHIKGNTSFRHDILSLHLVLRWIVCLLLIYNVIICGYYGTGVNEAGFLYGGF